MHYATSINVAGTKSFRLSTSKLLGYYGGNAQNPPPELCKCIVPSGPNRSFVQPDQSGAESLVVAMEAGNGLYRRILEAGIKQHSYFALHIFIDEFRGNSPKDTYWKRDPFELAALPQWPVLNKTIKKGEKGFPIWGQPVSSKGKPEAQQAADDSEMQYFPLCYLFHESQVVDQKAEAEA